MIKSKRSYFRKVTILLEIIKTESFIIRVQKIAAAIYYKNYKDFQYKGMVFNINNVDDLVLEAFANVVNAVNRNNELKNLNEPQAILYFKTTIKNILRNCLKKKLAIRNNANFVQLQDENYNINTDDASIYIERDNERKVNLALAISTIDDMKEKSPRCYKILKSLLKEMSYLEIAQDLGVSYSNFKVYVSRCRRLLVQNMQKISREIATELNESL